MPEIKEDELELKDSFTGATITFPDDQEFNTADMEEVKQVMEVMQ